MNQHTSFPLDIFAVKEYGIERWQDEFYWPVSDGEFTLLSRDIEESLAGRINAQPTDIADLFLIQRPLSFEYGNFLHALKVINEIRGEGKELLYSESALWYKDIARGVSVDNTALYMRNADCSLYNYSLLKNIKFGTMKLIKNVVYNPNLLRLSRPARIGRACGPISPLMRQYIKRSPSLFYFTSQADWLDGNSHNLPRGLKDGIREVSADYAGELGSIAARHKIGLSDTHADYLRNLTENALTKAAKLLYAVKAGASGRGRLELLLQNMGDPLHKALSILWRRAGGRVTTFSHGGFVGLYDTPILTFSEFSLADEFITYNARNIGLLEKIRDNRRPMRGNRIDIKSVNSREYLALWKKIGNGPLPRTVKRVMIIGFPYRYWRPYQSAGSLSLMQLDLELKIVRILREKGYEILYKIHPERMTEGVGIFDDAARVIKKGYFQDYLDAADAYIFGCIRTTAFPIALCTNKPIIGFKMDKEPFQPFEEPFGLLKKRCAFIDCSFDERNRITFGREAFLNALARKPEKPNNEFIERYMFP